MGELLYVANLSRPHIAYAVSQLCRYMARKRHIELAFRVLRYLKQTVASKLIYRCNNDLTIVYADADYNNNPQSKSNTGWMVFHYGNLIFWRSQRQSVVALSTTKAEITAMTSKSTEAVYVMNLMREILPAHLVRPFVFFCDNNSAVATVHIGGKFQRVKHYTTRVNYIFDCIDEKVFEVEHVGTEEMLADGLTKPVTRQRLQFLYTSAELVLDCGGVFRSPTHDFIPSQSSGK